jgi:hypothetical protein
MGATGEALVEVYEVHKGHGYRRRERCRSARSGVSRGSAELVSIRVKHPLSISRFGDEHDPLVIVDDDADHAFLLRRLLQRTGIQNPAVTLLIE